MCNEVSLSPQGSGVSDFIITTCPAFADYHIITLAHYSL